MPVRMDARAVLAPAKINLTLHVTGQRDDGYHLLDSLVVFASIGDRLSARPAPGVSVSVRGPFGAAVPTGADNLVLRAARLIGASDVAIALEKTLPPSSGMGGGSSDAAATLRLLAREQGLPLPDTVALMRLGADLPVCMAAPQPCRMRGLGEDVVPLANVPAMHLLIVNPGVPLSTPAVFRALARRQNPAMPEILPDWSDAAQFGDWLAGMRNDLERPACTLLPEIRTLINEIARQPGCRLARMTGSGATCFGLFDSQVAASRARDALARPGWFVQACATAHAAP